MAILHMKQEFVHTVSIHKGLGILPLVQTHDIAGDVLYVEDIVCERWLPHHLLISTPYLK